MRRTDERRRLISAGLCIMRGAARYTLSDCKRNEEIDGTINFTNKRMYRTVQKKLETTH
jgi:hypothetical protein